MEIPRILPLIPLTCLAIFTGDTQVSACGGWWEEEPPHSLAGDLDRLPAKTLGQILLETRGTGPDNLTFRVAGGEILEVVRMIGSKDAKLLAASLDSFAIRARASYALSSHLLNTLYDIRDAITSKGPTADERRTYAEWRVAHEPAVETQLAPEDHAKGDPMRPHKLYLEGAARFAKGDRQECRAWFAEIVKQFPDHPRAETARFLLARCDLWLARYTGEFLKEDEQNKRLTAAEAAFRGYLNLYPQGRYAADAHGWLGGILWESNPPKSLEHYILQFDDEAHPECAKSAAHMIEKALARAAANPDGQNEAKLQILAMHPRVAQAAVYYVLNSPEINPYDGKYDEPATLKQWRVKVLPKLAAAVSKEKSRYKGTWSLRMRAMLAQAASADGKQEEALKLTDGSPAEFAASDDLLFARLVALQRSGKSKETIEAGLLFLKTYTQSPLRAAVPVRLAQAMVDEHRAGEAFLNLCLINIQNVDRWNGRNDTIYPPGENDLDLTQSSVYPEVDGTDAAADLKETILNLAPLDELEAVAGRQEWSEIPDQLAIFKTMLSRRKASGEDFAGASKSIDDPQARERIMEFASLAEATAKGPPLEKARAMVALGDAFEAAWKRSRKNADETFFQGGASLVLRENGHALGFTNLDRELENRHPLRHAIRWWLDASRTAPGTGLAVKARVKTLEAMRLTALSSEYDFTRAIESDAAAASKAAYQVARGEARGAMYWSFPPCPKPGAAEGQEEYFDAWRVRWDIRGWEDSWGEVRCAKLLGGYAALPYSAFGDFPPLRMHDEPANAVIAPMLKELQEVGAIAAGLSERFPAEKVRRNFEAARESAENAAQSRITNLFEDLTLFYQVPGLPKEARDAYIQLRLRCSDFPEFRSWESKPDPRPAAEELFRHARENPALAPVRDFIDYAELYLSAKGGDALEGLEKECRAFLERQPTSARREACLLLLMRTIYRQQSAQGNAERADRADTEPVMREFHKEPLDAVIASYEKEFPKARYAAEVRNLRGIIAWRTHDHGPALDLTIAQLDDMTHLDLRREAAFRLANIFAALGDPLHRNEAVAAVKSRPPAMAKLKLYLAIAPHCMDHPLRCLTGMLEDELGLGAE